MVDSSQNDQLAACQKILGYKFKDSSILVRSLIHASVADSRPQSNERLEFLGDAILGMVICHALYERFPDYMEGELTKIKSHLVSRRACAKITDDLNVTQFLRVGKGMNNLSKLPLSCRAALFESLIGALYIDGGEKAAKAFILKCYEAPLEAANASLHQENYKSMLQQHAQQDLDATPTYEVLDEKGPDHSKCFEVCVVVGTHRFSSAWGSSKKESEQTAAFNALKELELISDDATFRPLSAS